MITSITPCGGYSKRRWALGGPIALSLLIPLSLQAGDRPELPPEDLKLGAELIEQRACRACHSIGGEGAVVGPALDQVTLRRSEDWIRDWLHDPSAIKPGTLMPEFEWTDEQYHTIIAYLSQYRKLVDTDAILANEPDPVKAGEQLIDAYQCWSCHRILDQTGRPIYPDLQTVKERHTVDWEKSWLKDPQRIKPGTFMPTFKLTEEEIDAITAYLYR